MFQFKKAERKQSKLRLALCGPSGSGKTYGALLLAKGIGGKIAVLDTEHGSASLYSKLCDFDVLELSAPYSPDRYIAAIQAAEKAGYDTLIIDSTTHEWSGSGGCLELNEEIARAKFKGNTWSAWSDTTAKHRKFIDAMLQSNMHIIATGRSKTETSQEEFNGKKRVVKLGMKTEQRDGFEYEFTVVLDIVHDGHIAVASKDRTNLFSDNPFKVSEETGKRLIEFLNSGAPMVVEPKAPPVEDRDFSFFYSAIAAAKEEDVLKSIFAEGWKAFKSDEDRAKLKASYEQRKAVLEDVNQDVPQ